MRAILIKTDEQKIEEVEFNGTLDDAYRLLGCELIERVELGNGEDLWVDEEGLINGRGRQFGFFCYIHYPQILAGRGLITGTMIDPNDPDEGETFGPSTTPLEDARKRVVWKP